MNILAIETSAKACSAAIIKGSEIFMSYTDDPATHSATLFPRIDEVFKSAGLTPQDIGLFAVANGPGSFTGLRIGIAAIKGFAWAVEKPCIGISTLAAAAMSYEGGEGCFDICALSDARRGQFYTAMFRKRGNLLERLTCDTVLPAEEIDKLLGTKVGTILIGDGAPAYRALFPDENYKGTIIPEKYAQNAKGVALAALGAASEEYQTASEIGAVYLRPSQAERLRSQNIDN